MRTARKICLMLIMVTVFFTFIPQIDQAFAASSKPGQVKSLSVKKTDQNQITVKWKKVKKAKKYQVYMKVDNGKFKKYKTTKKKSIRLTGKAGKKYTFKVRAVRGKKKGKFSKKKSVKISDTIIKTNDEVVVLDNDQIESYDVDESGDGMGNEILITAQAGTLDTVWTGMTVIMPPTEKYPTGYALYVDSVGSSGSELYMGGYQPDYDDVFDTINMDGTRNVDAIQNLKPADGVTVTGISNGTDPNTVKAMIKSGGAIPLFDGTSIDLSLPLSKDVDLTLTLSDLRLLYEIDYRMGKLNTLETGLRMDTGMSIGKSGSGEWDAPVEKRLKLMEFDAVIYGAIVAPIRLYAVVEVGGEITLEAEWSCGMRYASSKLKFYDDLQLTGLKADGYIAPGIGGEVGLTQAALPDFVNMDCTLTVPLTVSAETHFDTLNVLCLDLGAELKGSIKPGESFVQKHFAPFREVSFNATVPLGSFHFEGEGNELPKKVSDCRYNVQARSNYDPVLKEYRDMLSRIKNKTFNMDKFEKYGYKYIEYQLAALASNYYGEHSTPQYVMVDINGDGTKELIIGGKKDGYPEYDLSRIFTLDANYRPVELILNESYLYRAQLSVFKDGSIGYGGSSGATYNYFTTYTLNHDATKLTVIDEFSQEDEDFYHNGSSISESTYETLFSNYRNRTKKEFNWKTF